jgi:hypothetical protein
MNIVIPATEMRHIVFRPAMFIRAVPKRAITRDQEVRIMFCGVSQSRKSQVSFGVAHNFQLRMGVCDTSIIKHIAQVIGNDVVALVMMSDIG